MPDEMNFPGCIFSAAVLTFLIL